MESGQSGFRSKLPLNDKSRACIGASENGAFHRFTSQAADFALSVGAAAREGRGTKSSRAPWYQLPKRCYVQFNLPSASAVTVSVPTRAPVFSSVWFELLETFKSYLTPVYSM